MKSYLVAFDISDDKKRLKVGKELLKHGNRVQRSVFEIRVKSIEKLEQIQLSCNVLIEADDDIRYYHICANCRNKSIDGKGQTVMEIPLAVIV